MQEDLLQPHLTVLESMEIASKLRNCTLKLDIYNQILVRYMAYAYLKYTSIYYMFIYQIIVILRIKNNNYIFLLIKII